MKKLKSFQLNKTLILLIVFALIIGFIVGYFSGVYTTIKAVVEVANNFITIDYDTVNAAIFQYKNNIGGCLNNASLHSN